ncbi:hypothetical protein IKQ74_02845 [Candidatus Saccharibacteria bacterium]|nr:hypothetical protein [Candidatus Saccharibacteria bacterium]
MLKTWWGDIKQISNIDASWAVIWISIYCGFLLLDVFFPGWFGTSLLKYIGILLCVIYAYTQYSTDIMLSLALLFTFMADTVLVWTEWTVAGVYIFCFAQFMHLLRLCKAKFEYIFAWAAFVSIAFAIAVIQGCKPIYAIASIYALVLFSNLYFATCRFIDHKTDFKSRCALYGFIAFVCCDVCVATRFLALDGYLTLAVLPIVNFLVWVFYYPSQVLIANSSAMSPTPRLVKNLRK